MTKEEKASEITKQLFVVKGLSIDYDAQSKVLVAAQDNLRKIGSKLDHEKTRYHNMVARFFSMILIVPTLILTLGGCTMILASTADRTPSDLEARHPEWSGVDCERIMRLQTWAGETIEQFECTLGRGMDRTGWQPGIIGYAASGFTNHRHIEPSSVAYFNDGIQIRHYRLMCYSNSPGGASVTATFKNGRFVDAVGFRSGL